MVRSGWHLALQVQIALDGVMMELNGMLQSLATVFLQATALV